MARAARLISAYLEMPVEDYQVAVILTLVKIARSIEDAFALARSEEARRAYLPENNGLGFDDLSRARNTGSSCALPFVLFLATMAWVLW
jgi:hypothetical protein